MTDNDADKIFEKEAFFFVKEAGQTKEDELYTKIRDFLRVDEVNCVLLFPCMLGTIGKGLIILAERTEEMPGYKTIGRISGRGKEFLGRVAHEIRIEFPVAGTAVARKIGVYAYLSIVCTLFSAGFASTGVWLAFEKQFSLILKRRMMQ